tara:strand:+ start:2275 stop:2868 length:594 start_codon:yes stop_codon:yes gene_type:complete
MKLLSLLFLFLACTGPIEDNNITIPPIAGDKENNTVLQPLVMEGCGYDIGDIACGIHERNQDGKWQRLHDYEGKVILLEFGTLWCNFCMTAAFYHEDITKKFSKKKFQWVTVMLENWKGEKPYYEELQEFGMMYGMEEYPIWAGEMSMAADYKNGIIKWPIGGVPTFFVINKDFKITAVISGWEPEKIIKQVKRAGK